MNRCTWTRAWPVRVGALTLALGPLSGCALLSKSEPLTPRYFSAEPSAGLERPVIPAESGANAGAAGAPAGVWSGADDCDLHASGDRVRGQGQRFLHPHSSAGHARVSKAGVRQTLGEGFDKLNVTAGGDRAGSLKDSFVIEGFG